MLRVCCFLVRAVNCFRSGAALAPGHGKRISVLLSVYLGMCSVECGVVLNNTFQS